VQLEGSAALWAADPEGSRRGDLLLGDEPGGEEEGPVVADGVDPAPAAGEELSV